ncbi:hypothetical protein ACKI16_29270 [Streptomyces scabiei]|uniref:hypothetical protein n=1 Tax=Streptomyces scabiei TaxID=1930 RepID=UPI0038F71782
MEPINTCDPAAAVRAYMALHWPVGLGHRYRPRQGCTCEQTDCPAPGAHPGPQPTTWLTADTVDAAVRTAPGVGVIAGTERFDAVVVPRFAGMAVVAWLDRVMPVPCLVSETTATLLVLPATGRYAQVDPRVEVRAGSGGWIALPPSRGYHWDTPPWIESTVAPRALLHGGDIGRHLAAVLADVTPADERAAIERRAAGAVR